jgi:hypothetical protein
LTGTFPATAIHFNVLKIRDSFFGTMVREATAQAPSLVFQE